MDTTSLLGVWTGNVHKSNDWDMKVTISILQHVEIGSNLGVFDIPLIPCAGTFRVIDIRGETIEVKAEKLQGQCIESDTASLELLPDGTLLYMSNGADGETRGILHRSSQ
jgi:hypothetical protein